MTPSALNKICAHPTIVAWAVGACVLNAVVVGFASNGVNLSAIFADWQGVLCLLLAVVSASGLGFFLGMFTCWPLIRVVCSRFNGAPLKIGDRVLILAGPHKGNTAEVYEITVGQGGWELARLDLGQERKERFRDIFEEYSVLKVKKEEPDSASACCASIGMTLLRV